MDWEPAFILGTIFGALLLFAYQSLLHRRRQKRAGRSWHEAAIGSDERGRLREIEELHARLAVLERIATDPAGRTASEIEELR